MSQASGQSDVDRVREATDLVALIGEHLPLTQRGREHVGVCPFHDDHSPSLSVVTHKGHAFYKCHACGAAGDAFKFVMDYHKKEFREALAFLAQRAGITLRPRAAAGPAEPRDDLRAINKQAVDFFRRTLRDAEQGRLARSALESRGVSREMIDRFQLGAAPDGYGAFLSTLRSDPVRTRAAQSAGLLKPRGDGSLYDAFRNRIIFPIADEMGHPIAFGARRIDPKDEPKYLNSSESPIFSKSRTLYGLHLARRAILASRQVIVTEGYTDVIAAHQAGIENVVGTLGTALTIEHARHLVRLCDVVVLVFDGDEAGQRAADRAVEVLFSQPVEVRICVLPDELDPDELLRRPGGPEAFAEAVAAARDALTYKLERFAAQLEAASGVAARERLLAEFLGRLGELGFGQVMGVRKRHLLASLSQRLAVPVHELERAIPRQRPGPARPAATAPVSETSAEPVMGGPAPATSVTITRARLMAEWDLLAVVVFEPAAMSVPLGWPDDPEATVAGRFGAGDFADEAAGAIFARLQEGAATSVQQLMDCLQSEPQRRLASGLYFEGQRCCGDEGERVTEALHRAAEALRDCMERERYRQKVAAQTLRAAPQDQRVSLLHELLEARRRHGDMTAAILPSGRR